MSKEEDELRRAFMGLTCMSVIPAKVVAVNEDTATIDVDIDGVEFPDVRLRSIITSSGNRCVAIPSIDSIIHIQAIGKSNHFIVVGFSEISKVIVKIQQTEFIMDESGIVFNSGSNTTAKADILKSELEKLTARVDGIIDALNNASPDSAAGTFKSSLIPMLASIIQKEDFSNIENKKIKH